VRWYYELRLGALVLYDEGEITDIETFNLF